MKAIDIVRMALRNLRGKWMLAPLACLILCTVCLCYAGAVIASVSTEKHRPCELTVTAPYGRITEQSVADIGRIPDVVAATAVLPVQAVLTSGQYAASITLQGIDGHYPQEEYATGGTFPDDTFMPYIVLNQAGEKSFIDPEDPPSPADTDYRPDIDWFHAGIALYMGGDTEARPATAKVCGILSGDGDTQGPAGYISIFSAKALLTNQDMPATYAYALVRIKDMGAAEDVARQIRLRGYDAGDADPALQAKWAGQEKEMIYLLWMGLLSLAVGVLLTASIQREAISDERDKLDMLRWMGMTQTAVKGISYGQAAAKGILSAALGILISYPHPRLYSRGAESHIHLCAAVTAARGTISRFIVHRCPRVFRYICW